MNRFRYWGLILTIIMISGLITCSAMAENILLPVINDNVVSPIMPDKNLAGASNRFGFNLFHKLTAVSPVDQNICISPLSVSYALTMTYNGAAGKTREAMAATLEIAGLPSDFINDSYRQLTTALATADSSLAMEIANSIWYQHGLAVKAPFLDLSRSGFDAAIRELDFSNPQAAEIINGWVSAKTHDRIKQIIEPPIDSDIIMMLINAVYFKAPWTTPFDASLTKSTPFNLPDGSQTECRMMNKLDDYQYLEDELLQMVDLPYGNGKFSMAIIMPRSGMALGELIGQLNDEKLAGWLNRMSTQGVRLFLPRFRFSGDFGLNQALKSMGMKFTFRGQMADFSNMADGRIWLDSVIHKTFIQIEETGTEATAATAVIMQKGLMPSMVVDRPFLFAIRHRESNTLLFLGKVVNPIWEKKS